MDRFPNGRGPQQGDGLLHDDQAWPRWCVPRRSVFRRVSGRARRSGGAAARRGKADDAADAREVSVGSRRCVHFQRLLRQRCRLDGARCLDRSDDRSLRGVRRRMVQLQGRLRSVHHATRRRGDEEAAVIRRRAAGPGECTADRSEVSQSPPRRDGPNPRRQRRLHCGRREQRRADRRVQPSERRTCGQGKKARSA